MLYAECGMGNAHFLSTEVEQDGPEFRVKGWFVEKPISIYIRVWVKKVVVIVDSREGIKITRKSKNHLKLLVGVKSQ